MSIREELEQVNNKISELIGPANKAYALLKSSYADFIEHKIVYDKLDKELKVFENKKQELSNQLEIPFQLLGY